MSPRVARLPLHALPLVLEPPEPRGQLGFDLLEYVGASHARLVAALRRHGALLFRGFAVDDARAFRDVVARFAPALQRYRGGDSPRTAVIDEVYTSTSYPPSLPISLHNEMSYTRDYPAVIAFYCEVPPQAGGETPLADCRRLLDSLSPQLVNRFATRKLRYVQNLPSGAGIGKSWQATFETDDRAAVSALLAARGAELTWKRDGGLRVAEVVDPVVTHPHTGEAVFFCQAHLWHVSGLDPRTRRALEKLQPEDELYHHCTFGDGAPLEEGDLQELRRALDDAAVALPWRQGDVLLVDNLLVAHGRRPFAGPRRILVAMG